MTTPAKPKLTAAQRTALILRDNRSSRFCTPINIGPLNVKRATGVNASI